MITSENSKRNCKDIARELALDEPNHSKCVDFSHELNQAIVEEQPKDMDDLRLLLVFEFAGDEPTSRTSFADMRGIPIPMIGDSVCPGKGKFKVLSRTFRYEQNGLAVYYACVPDKISFGDYYST